MTRRPDLPGVDSLFGSTATPKPAPPVSDSHPAASEPAPQSVAKQPTPAAPPEPAKVDDAMRDGALKAVCDTSVHVTAAIAAAANVQTAPSDEVGALLRWLVASTKATHVVEVGSAGGVTGLWSVENQPQVTLTSIEQDEHLHKLAKQVFKDARVTSQVRAIHADGTTVLPRLADESYDLIVLQAGAGKLAGDLAEAVRILKPGGTLLARGVLRGGAHAKANAAFVSALVEHRFMTVTVLTVDDGVLLATKTV